MMSSRLSSTTCRYACLVRIVGMISYIQYLMKCNATTFGAEEGIFCTDEDECDNKPGHFCGMDGQCHEFSCQNYYQFAHPQLTGYADDTTFQCFGYSLGDQENAHAVIYGCDPLFPFVFMTPGKQVTESFNRKCTAEREGGYKFECYEFQPSATATDFTFFEQTAESYFPDCEGGKQPKYYYMIASSNRYLGFEGLLGNPIVVGGAEDDGATIWQTNEGSQFNRSLAMLSMYANVVGGPSPVITTMPIQAGSLGNNPLQNPSQSGGGYGDYDENDEETSAGIPSEGVEEDHSNNIFDHSSTYPPSTLLPSSSSEENGDNIPNDADNGNLIPTNTSTTTTTTATNSTSTRDDDDFPGAVLSTNTSIINGTNMDMIDSTSTTGGDGEDEGGFQDIPADDNPADLDDNSNNDTSALVNNSSSKSSADAGTKRSSSLSLLFMMFMTSTGLIFQTVQLDHPITCMIF